MSDYLEAEPDDFRRIAGQHDAQAANLRKWGEIPQTWLDDFPSMYGTIADQMHAALVSYTSKRHDDAEHQAVLHEQTRDQLLRAANELEGTDQTGGHQIASSGNHGFDISPGLSNGNPAAHPAIFDDLGRSPTASRENAPVRPAPPVVPSTPGPADFSDPTMAGQVGPTHTDETVIAPVFGGQMGDLSTAGTTPKPGTTTTGPTAANSPTNTNTIADGTIVTAYGVPTTMSPGPHRAPDAGNTYRRGLLPALPTGPFVAATHADKARQSLPPLRVGEHADDDLALARTLLAATLEAAGDSSPDVDWATAVCRTDNGPIVLLTSAEGRGWLPAGVYLPSEVIIPWRWDHILSKTDRTAISALEGTPDPARILVEFGIRVPHEHGLRISAIASSNVISERLLDALDSDVALASRVSAAGAQADFRSPGVGLADRLALAGSEQALHQALTVPEKDIRTALNVLLGSAEALMHAPAITSHNQHLLESKSIHTRFFSRRLDELRRLVTATGNERQMLRDALYTHSQIAEHPSLSTIASDDRSPRNDIDPISNADSTGSRVDDETATTERTS